MKRKPILFIVLFILILSIGGTTKADISERYIYGYVNVEQINLYFSPDENAEQFNNYTRAAGSVRTIGKYFVMKGAILRTSPVNDTWGKVVTDSTWKVYEGATVYVKYSDLTIIPESDFEPIGYLVNPDTQKAIVVVINDRTIALMEGDTVAYKGNVVVNPRVPDSDPEGTPRGSWYISQTTVSRDMPGRKQDNGSVLPGFPGVSWAALLGGDDTINSRGYWFHSSAWFDWSEMDSEKIYEYHTGGCVSSPTWNVQIDGFGEIRADQLIWRWIGGNPEASTTKRYSPVNLVRVYIVNDMADLTYPPFNTTMRATNVDPVKFLENLANAKIWEPVEQGE